MRKNCLPPQYCLSKWRLRKSLIHHRIDFMHFHWFVHRTTTKLYFYHMNDIGRQWQYRLIIYHDYFRVGVVTGVILTSTSNKSARIPLIIIYFLTSCCIFSLTKEQVALRNLSVICVLLNSPSKPKNFRSIAMSISSENRSIIFQHLLRDVPPLNEKYFAYDRENNARNTCVTHQSFSVVCWSSPVLLRT